MSKFKRVLSDVDFMEILSKTNGFSPTSDGEVYVGSGDDVWFALADFAEKVEQATIAALKEQQEEQEPVAWRVWLDDLQCWSYSCDYHGCGEPLYAHPVPNQARIKEVLRFAAQVIELYDDATLVSDNYMLTSTDCAEIIKELVDYMPCVSTAIDKTACVSENTKYAMQIPEGWQLVPKEPTIEMYDAWLSGKDNERHYWNDVYKAMLAAAPKYDGGSYD